MDDGEDVFTGPNGGNKGQQSAFVWCRQAKEHHAGKIELKCSSNGQLTADTSDCGKLPYDGDPFGSFPRIGVMIMGCGLACVSVAGLIRRMERKRLYKISPEGSAFKSAAEIAAEKAASKNGKQNGKGPAGK